MAKAILKTNFEIEQRFEAFYTGGIVSINSNGSKLFTTCGNVVNILDVYSGAKIGTIGSSQSDDEITCFVLRPSDGSIVVAYRNSLLKHYSISDTQKTEAGTNDNYSNEKINARILRTWRSNHRGPIIRMAFSPNGRLLATGGSDSLVKIWDLELQYCVFSLRGAVGIIGTLFFETAINDRNMCDRFYYGGDDGKLLCWNLKENELTTTLDLHTSSVTAVAIHGNYLFTAGRDSVIGIWDRHSLKLKKTLPVFESLETLVATSNHGKTVVIGGGEKGTVKIWDIDTGKCITSSVVFGSCVKQLFACNIQAERSLIAVTEDHVIYFLNVSDLSITKHLVGYNDEVLDAAFLPNDHIAVACNSKDIRIYNIKTSDCRLVSGHSDIVMAIDVAKWCPTLFASGSKDNTLRIWRFSEDSAIKCIAFATGHTNNISRVCFAKIKGTFIASVSEDTTLKIWKLPTTLTQSNEISSDESDLIRLTAASTAVGHEKDITCLDVSPNNKLVATGSMDKTVKIWQITPKTYVATLIGTITGHKRGIWDVCFSPVDQVVATASGDWTVKIFALEDFSCIKTFEGHQTTAIRTRFLPSGVQLLSSDSSGLLKLWNIKGGECVKTFDEHSKTVWALELNDDGSKLLTGGGDSKLQIWKDTTEEERELGHEKRAKQVADEQMLSNLIDEKQFTKAFQLAIRLGRPFNTFKISKDMLLRDQETELTTALKSLAFDDIGVLLDWISEWNTNSRNCHVAQKLLTIILHQHTPERLLQLPNIKSIIEALIPYGERHYERLGRLRQQATFAQYSWQCMRLTGRNDTGEVDKSIKEEILR